MQNFDPKAATSDVAQLRAALADLTQQLTHLVETQLAEVFTRLTAIENQIAPVIRDYASEIAGQGKATQTPIPGEQIGQHSNSAV